MTIPSTRSGARHRRDIGYAYGGYLRDKLINPSGADGLLYGNPKQLMIQAFAVIAAVVYTLVVTFAIYKLIDMIIGVRVGERDEVIGLDLTQHREGAYTILE